MWRVNTERIERARQERNWTIAELARRSGLHKRTMARVLAGGRPTNTTLKGIARALELPAGSLLEPPPVELWPWTRSVLTEPLRGSQDDSA